MGRGLMLRKLLITHWFGPPPEWYDLWAVNIGRLARYGYDVLIEGDEDAFADLAKRKLGVTYPKGDGRKVCDYRAAFGVLYADELKDYDYFGHTDLDCVYGRVGHFLPDEVLRPVEVFSNHPTYVSGPWSLYKNTPLVNETFRLVEDWRGYLENPATTGWVETVFSDAVMDHLAFRFENWQTQNLDRFDTVRFEGDMLMEGRTEIMVAHFRRTKQYPRGCR